MRSVQALRFAALVAALVVVASYSADAAGCVNGNGNCTGNSGNNGNGGNGGTVVAPAPLLGTGILGVIVLVAGFLGGTRRKR